MALVTFSVSANKSTCESHHISKWYLSPVEFFKTKTNCFLLRCLVDPAQPQGYSTNTVVIPTLSTKSFNDQKHYEYFSVYKHSQLTKMDSPFVSEYYRSNFIQLVARVGKIGCFLCLYNFFLKWFFSNHIKKEISSQHQSIPINQRIFHIYVP